MAFNYSFRVAVSLAVALLAGVMWTVDVFWGALCTALLPIALYWQQKLYRHHVRKVLFMLDAIENNDNAIHFSETENTADARLVNRALNRVAHILYNVKSETAQQEKYYELILDCVNTGILVLNDNGAVYQKNSEALRLLGLNVFTHVSQLNRVDPRLSSLLANCRPGDKLQMPFVTPITSLSDTLLGLTEAQASKEEIRNGLQTISSTGKGLLSFVESYRKFTRIPTPEPSLFYVKSFIERMVELARHQHPDVRVTFHTDIAPSDLILYADENLVSQVVINLLKNAIQAIESDKNTDKEGHINIRAYCNEAEAILIEISNNGPAIPNDIAEHIFIPFFTTKEGGSGIGLSISRQIMRLSGGNLSLLPGKETTFILKFN